MSSELERAKQEVTELVNILYGQMDIAVKMAMKGYMDHPDADKPEYWEMIRMGLAGAAGATGKALPSKGPAGDFRYKEDGGSITITGYKGGSKEVTIPGEIDGKPVTRIGTKAFYQSDVTDLTIPDSVTTIEDEACGYNELTNVTIGNGVKVIGKQAFMSNVIEKLILGKSVVTIEEEAFYDNRIKTLTIPESVKEIGMQAFLYKNEFKEVIIPDGDVFIGKSAFSKNVKITTVSGTVIDLNKKPEKIKSTAAPANPEPPKNIFCTGCGNKLAVGVKFCNKCGKPAPQPPVSAAAAPVTAASQADAPYVRVKCTACGVMPSSDRWFCTKCGTPTALPVPVIGPDLDESKMADRYKIEELKKEIIKYEEEKLNADEKAKAYYLVKEHKEGVYSYKLGDNAIIITGYDGPAGDIQLPAQINGKTVTEIGENAFDNKGLTNVTIPANIKSIGFAAFSRNKLTSITIPGTVDIIGNSAFSSNPLTSIVIQDGVKEIGESAFVQTTRFNEDVSKVDNVIIPGSVKKIGTEAFYRSRIGSITISAGVQSIGEKAFMGNQLKSVVIPEGITEIGKQAFYENFITSVSFPASLKKIGEDAFRVNKIQSLSLPPNLANLGEYVFSGNKLTEITIPASLKKISPEAFAENEIERITISEGVTTIGAGAFRKNKISDNRFVSTLLPASLEAIGNEAFASNQFKGNIIIPVTVKKIGNEAYRYNNLTGVELRGKTEIGERTFANNQINKIILGNNIPSVGKLGFAFNEPLIAVTVPKSVKLGKNAFTDNIYMERKDTDGITFDDFQYWQNFENKIKANKAARAPGNEITLHDANGKLIGRMGLGDYKGVLLKTVVIFRDYVNIKMNYRGNRTTVHIFDLIPNNGYKGQVFIRASGSFDHDSCDLINFAAMTEMFGDVVQIDSFVTSDGVVLYKGKQKSFPLDNMVSDGLLITSASAVKIIEEYKIGTVKVEGNTGVAYNKAGVKVGEARNAGEFAAVFAGALLRFLI